MTQLDESENVILNVRALADLKSRLLTAEKTASTATNDIELLENSLSTAEVELSRVQSEFERAQTSEVELTEALRLAQTVAWESSKALISAESQLERSAAEAEALREQIQRINNSKAWKAVSAYRRVVKRLRLSR